MADQDALLKPFRSLSRMPAVRQLGLLIGLAFSVALGVGLVSWSREPNFVPLVTNLPEREIPAVVSVLEGEGVIYRMQGSSLLVPAGVVHNLRIKLAGQGLPKGGLRGFELLDEEQGFGTSSFLETARFNQALEGELSKSVAALDGVKNARVHLAIPKRSAFLRDRTGASASVLVGLYPGSTLSDGQIAGIVHLIASSVPNMDSDSVSIVNQKGELLTFAAGSSSSNLSVSADQRGYARNLEEDYSERILELLAPILGAGKVRAQVTADIDFTAIERTSEIYGRDNASTRSEQISEERSTASGGYGVPGTLSNQPPPEGVIAGSNAVTSTAVAAPPERVSKQQTKNYELDRTISHVNEMPGTIRRLSVGVVLDYRDQIAESGEAERVPLSDEELQRYTVLVKEAVGFSEVRGDSVNLVNAPFLSLPEPEALPDVPFWKQPWLLNVGKQVLAAVGIALLVFGVLRPVMKSLAAYSGPAPGLAGQLPGLDAPAMVGELQPGSGLANVGATGGAGLPGSEGDYAQQLAIAQNVAREDPRRAAQVVKGWVSEDE